MWQKKDTSDSYHQSYKIESRKAPTDIHTYIIIIYFFVSFTCKQNQTWNRMRNIKPIFNSTVVNVKPKLKTCIECGCSSAFLSLSKYLKIDKKQMHRNGIRVGLYLLTYTHTMMYINPSLWIYIALRVFHLFLEKWREKWRRFEWLYIYCIYNYIYMQHTFM